LAVEIGHIHCDTNSRQRVPRFFSTAVSGIHLLDTTPPGARSFITARFRWPLVMGFARSEQS
jgi:hypothetical protein